MAGARSLTIAEVRMIKALLDRRPRFSKQRVLSYFTRPDRDLNSRLMTEIANGQRWATEPPATPAEAEAFIEASAYHRPLAAEDFVDLSPAGGPRERKHILYLDWWSAGQGLFASGMISRTGGAPLVWVYDCGTTSKAAILTQSRKAFERQFNRLNGQVIQLAVLSHFDNDHLSGLVKLLDVADIRILLLPYIPAWRRLAYALDRGVDPDAPEFGFFLNPAAYLANVADGRIDRIVFVPPSQPGEAAPDIPEAPRLPSIGGEDFDEVPSKDLWVEEGAPPPSANGDEGAVSQSGLPVTFLQPGGRIEASGLWEFVPYNDAEMAPRVSAADVAAIEALRDQLLQTPATRQSSLDALKAYYERLFPKTKERNLISLFLYSGPVGRRYRLELCRSCHPEGLREPLRFSQMHTGDGYLEDDARLRAFEAHYRFEDRLARSAVLQVMHHGSRENWHDGVAARLNPLWSIFSSDPMHKTYGHPHAEVLRDFWMHGPVQVDGDRRFHMHGWLKR
ncbi:hypothetical protein D3C72_327710 [compost metagenome]